VRRSVLLSGFTLDAAGFAPPLRVEGGAGVQPLLQVGGCMPRSRYARSDGWPPAY
jgi:hypothetical protein